MSENEIKRSDDVKNANVLCPLSIEYNFRRSYVSVPSCSACKHHGGIIDSEIPRVRCRYPRIIDVVTDTEVPLVDPLVALARLFSVSCPLANGNLSLLECLKCEHNGGAT